MTKQSSDPAHEQRRAKALGMGGAAALEKRRQLGVLNARERLDRLFDPGTFVETGLFANSIREADREGGDSRDGPKAPPLPNPPSRGEVKRKTARGFATN